MDNLFLYLCVGLAEARAQKYRYPFNKSDNPKDEGRSNLLYALSGLATKMAQEGKIYNYTLPQVFELFEQPIKNWWPGQLPEGVEDYITLLNDGYLDYVDEYLGLQGEELQKRFKDLNEVLDFEADNRMGKWVDYCRRNDSTQQYVASRYFIITHPWTTPSELADQEAIWGGEIYNFVHAFYQSYNDFRLQALANPDKKYYSCPYCGWILDWRDNEPFCAKHSLCSSLSNKYLNYQPLTEKIPMRLRPTIHKRICLPGKPEIELFDWLIKDTHGPQLASTEVHLWPSVDRYDLRVHFKGQTWAVDVKDYTSPIELGLKEKKQGFNSYPADNWLHWDRAFYVIPDYRIQKDKRYTQRVKEKMGQALKHNVAVKSMSEFKQEVMLHV